MMNPDGDIIDEFTFPNDAEGILGLASRLTPEDRVVMGSTGSVWSTLYNLIDERHIPVTLANFVMGSSPTPRIKSLFFPIIMDFSHNI